jgi:hypothetical protein
MEAQNDFKELLELLNGNAVEFLVVGAYALGAFGFHSPELSVQDFTKIDRVVQLGDPPVRVDLLTSITGVSWEEAESGKAGGDYGDVPVFFLGRAQYVRNKRATGRLKDLADLEALGER